jgi:hypothetical protein
MAAGLRGVYLDKDTVAGSFTGLILNRPATTAAIVTAFSIATS